MHLLAETFDRLATLVHVSTVSSPAVVMHDISHYDSLLLPFTQPSDPSNLQLKPSSSNSDRHPYLSELARPPVTVRALSSWSEKQ